MKLFEQLVLKDSIEIKTSPEKVWDFFYNLEKNYRKWHLKDHVLFKWTKGKPMETGSEWYGEEYLGGELKKAKGTIGEVVPYRKIVFEYAFPLSIASPGFEWLIEPKGSNSVFTAVSYIRAERIMRKLVTVFHHHDYKNMETLIAVGKKHVKEEGENLKKILESENYGTVESFG
jgi:uncharacterized protein YndB with AHSA1/START domain